MQNKLLIPSLILCMVFILILILSSASVGESGGTEGTEVYASTIGGGGGDPWNSIGSFYMRENYTTVQEGFNITLCENVSYVNDTWTPTGHIFWEMQGIEWENTPRPIMNISLEDFETYKQSRFFLTLYIFGNYTNSSTGERFAFRPVTITPPSDPPVTVVWVAEEGNWSWINLSIENDVTFIVEEGNNITLCFNSSNSWDPDGENVTKWNWVKDVHGSFGCPWEVGENISLVFDVGYSYEIEIEAFDERGVISEIYEFVIRVKSPELRADLTIGEIDYENKNANKQNFEIGDHIILQPKINNWGNNDSEFPFTVLIEYSSDGGDSFIELSRMNITDEIVTGNFQLLTYNWNTNGFSRGQYIIRVTADIENTIVELFEDNNVNRTYIINLERAPPPCCQLLEIQSVLSEKTHIIPNEVTNLSITIRNTGAGDAYYVDIHYFINDLEQYLKTFALIKSESNKTVVFTFSPDTIGIFNISFTLHDDGSELASSETIKIIVTDKIVPIAFIESISPNPAKKDQLITFRGSGSGYDTIISYHWRSSKDGYLNSNASFSSSNLSVGTHLIHFMVLDNYGRWSDDVSAYLVIKNDKSDNEIVSNHNLALVVIGVIIVSFLVIEKRKRISG